MCSYCTQVQRVIYVSLTWMLLSIVFEEYEKIANKCIEDSIKSETHGSLEEAMLTVGKKEAWLSAHLYPQPRKVAADDWISVIQRASPTPSALNPYLSAHIPGTTPQKSQCGLPGTILHVVYSIPHVCVFL